MPSVIDAAREHRRREDARFAGAIVRGVATGCPFPVVVFYEPDYERLRVTAGSFPDRVTLAVVGADELRDRSGDLAAILYVINRALLGYEALEPLPHDHHLGQD